MHRDSLLAALHRHLGDAGIRHVINAFGNSSSITTDEVANVVMPCLARNSGTISSEILPLLYKEVSVLESGLLKANIRVITIVDKDYPKLLLALRNPPPLLYVRGATEPLYRAGIGICGSRKVSNSGLAWARTFGAMVATLRATEVSGYAQGVDTEAHLGALEAGGKTTIVLAEGILHFRLKNAFHMIPSVLERMTIISEFHPTRPWHVSTAMKRNGTICALSKGLVVVEAGATGGTLAAGKECLKQKKPLLVVEYGDPSKMPQGNSQLIKDGGIGVRTLRELKEQLARLQTMDERSVAHQGEQGSLGMGRAPVSCDIVSSH